VRPDPARPRNFIRTPFPGNVIPKSRFANPAYDAIAKLYPLPNNDPLPGRDPVNNYLASKTPYNWDYKAYSNRIDYQISDKWRTFGRWSFNDFGPEDRGDWTYETARGLNSNGLNRNNKGGNVDIVYTQSPTLIWNLNVAMNQFREGNIRPVPEQFKPSDIGLPAYLDQKAGDQALLPQMNVNGYSTISPSGISIPTRYRIMTVKFEGTKIKGKHTLRGAFDNRNHFRTGGGGGNTSGNFAFSNAYTRRNDDGLTPASNLAHGWAAFILGIPNSATIATNDSYAMHNPYYAAFLQDSWRVSTKLTLNIGLRMEYERGATERYNRLIGGFDPNIELPIAQAAQAAYARNPIPELPASQFVIRGSNVYPGTGSTPRNLYKNELMWLPRFGAAYRVKQNTAIRVGYGIFFDTINVLNFGPDQFGFSRTTSSIITTDFGQNWNFPAAANPLNGNSPLRDPFPVRADGSRFDVPTQSALGAMARPGRGFSFTDFNQPHARQQRWRAGVQHQLGKNMVVEAAYSGSYSDRISISRTLSALPEQFWASGLARNDAVANNLNANLPNPFYIRNFNAAQFTPEVWADMQTIGFYNSPTIRRHQLLRPFPHINGLTNNHETSAYVKTHQVELSFEKRFSSGWNFHAGYTATRLREADFYMNEFDAFRTERTSNDGRPQRLVLTGIYELPFGRGRRFASGIAKPLDMLIGGWQMSATYEYQPGPLIDWGNLFYYGDDLSQINNVERTWDTWFNTANFERVANRGPAAFHRRVFPTRLPDMRRDLTNQWNGNVAKNMRFTERWNLQLRLDALNVLNRSQMNEPNTNPFSTDFGRITSQTAATNRWIQVQARITF
jgi:hypothetical protein